MSTRGYSSPMTDWTQHACSFMICVLCGGTLGNSLSVGLQFLVMISGTSEDRGKAKT